MPDSTRRSHHRGSLAAIVGVALAALLLLPGVAAAAGLQLGDADNGKTVTVVPNTTVSITIASNITTGYQWVVITTPDPKVAALAAGTGQYTPPNSTLIGAGGTQTFVFRSVAPGATKLVLGYQRVNDTAPLKTYTLEIKVIGAVEQPPTTTTGDSGGPTASGLLLLAVLSGAALGFVALRRRIAA